MSQTGILDYIILNFKHNKNKWCYNGPYDYIQSRNPGNVKEAR